MSSQGDTVEQESLEHPTSPAGSTNSYATSSPSARDEGQEGQDERLLQTDNTTNPANAQHQSTLYNHFSTCSPTLDRTILSRANFIDLSPLASWTVSSAKPNFGIANIHDASLETYWQSDGPQPHSINIHFPRLVRIQWLSIFLSFGGDESYTPSEILIRSGTGRHELLDVCSEKFVEPQGWQHIDLTKFLAPVTPPPPAEDGPEDDHDEGGLHLHPNGPAHARRRPEKAFFSTRLLQVQVLTNHQNGKDSHIRSIRIFKPRAQEGLVLPAETPSRHKHRHEPSDKLMKDSAEGVDEEEEEEDGHHIDNGDSDDQGTAYNDVQDLEFSSFDGIR